MKGDAPARAITAYMCLGSNIGDRRGYIERGLGALQTLASDSRVGRSSLYESLAWGIEDQPPYLNCVAVFRTILQPMDLLDAVKSIEREAGRRPDSPRWGPRELDIDILLIDGLRMATDNLTIPHLHLLRRRFVLEPLAEIAPELALPGMDMTVNDALGRCEDQGWVRRF